MKLAPILLSSFLLGWQEFLVFKTLFDVDNKSDGVFIAYLKGVPSLIDLIGSNQLDFWDNSMVCAKLQAFLCGFDSTDVRP